LALGAPFCELAPFLEALLVDAIRAPCSVTTAAVSVGLVASRVATQHGIGLEYAQRKYAAEPVGKFWISLARMVIEHFAGHPTLQHCWQVGAVGGGRFPVRRIRNVPTLCNGGIRLN